MSGVTITYHLNCATCGEPFWSNEPLPHPHECLACLRKHGVLEGGGTVPNWTFPEESKAMEGKMGAELILMAAFLGAGNLQIEHGMGTAYIRGFEPGDVFLWSVLEGRAECQYYVASVMPNAVTIRCRVHRDCNAVISWAAWRAEGKEEPAP